MPINRQQLEIRPGIPVNDIALTPPMDDGELMAFFEPGTQERTVKKMQALENCADKLPVIVNF